MILLNRVILVCLDASRYVRKTTMSLTRAALQHSRARSAAAALFSPWTSKAENARRPSC
jgi:hypothetical protein